MLLVKKRKTIDDIIFMTKGCYYSVGGTVYTFKKIGDDVLFCDRNGYTSFDINLQIDESGNNLIIPKKENDPIFIEWYNI